MSDSITNQPMEKLPQNIQALIGEIGEKQVLLRLYLLARGTSWNVFHNLGEAGYDVLLLHSESGQKVRIEVKTRQALYSTGKHSNQIHFMLTDGEYKACDFLVGYRLDANEFYIVPKADLKRASSNGILRWRIVVTLNKAGEPHPRFEKYRNAWGNLIADIPCISEVTEQAPIEDEATLDAEFADFDDWPELKTLLMAQEMERQEIWQNIETEKFVHDLEDRSEQLFWAKEVQESLGDNLEKMKALSEEWDPQVFEIVKKLTEASKRNMSWTIKTKVVTGREPGTHSLCWEVLFVWMGQSWYVVELEIDMSSQPKGFRVECKEPGYWIETEPTIGGLKQALAQAFQLGKVSAANRKERSGWTLRSETGKRY